MVIRDILYINFKGKIEIQGPLFLFMHRLMKISIIVSPHLRFVILEKGEKNHGREAD